MIDPFIERLIGLFSPAEWKALIWLMVITLAATHTIKVAWRLSPIRGASNGAVYLIAAVVGFVSAYFIWPSQSVPWFIAGVTAGPASNVAFKIAFALLEKFLPGVSSAVNFDRRKADSGAPPDGIPRRKEDEVQK